MPLPFQLQKLPPEALDLLRYLGTVSEAVSTDQMEESSGLSARLVGKAIRRLINYDYISMDGSGRYGLTTDGKLAIKDIAQYDAEMAGQTKTETATVAIPRRLTVVLPRSLAAGKPVEIYFGVNPPAPDHQKLPGVANIELKISAVGGTLNGSNLSLAIPPDKAAAPSKLALTPVQPGKLRVRVDAFQAFEFDSLEPLGGMYFDVQVAAQPPADAASRAVGMDLMLKPPR